MLLHCSGCGRPASPKSNRPFRPRPGPRIHSPSRPALHASGQPPHPLTRRSPSPLDRTSKATASTRPAHQIRPPEPVASPGQSFRYPPPPRLRSPLLRPNRGSRPRPGGKAWPFPPCPSGQAGFESARRAAAAGWPASWIRRTWREARRGAMWVDGWMELSVRVSGVLVDGPMGGR